jgi:hypothetical protein
MKGGYNFNAMTKALKLVMNCEALSLEESFQGTCFGHVFPKVFNHATTNGNCVNFLKLCFDQVYIRIFIKVHNMAQKYGKGKQKWNRACVDFGIHPRKLNTLMKTR